MASTTNSCHSFVLKGGGIEALGSQLATSVRQSLKTAVIPLSLGCAMLSYVKHIWLMTTYYLFHLHPPYPKWFNHPCKIMKQPKQAFDIWCHIRLKCTKHLSFFNLFIIRLKFHRNILCFSPKVKMFAGQADLSLTLTLYISLAAWIYPEVWMVRCMLRL